MRSISAREANQGFSRWLAEAEAGEEVVITRRGKPVATLTADKEPKITSERKVAIDRAIAMMENAPSLGTARRFTRDEMHER